MKIDITKTVPENILALIKAKNPVKAADLTLEKITIGAAEVLTGDATYNSRLTITAVPNAGFSGTRAIRFNRLTVSQGVATLPPSISINPSDTQAQRITKVAVALGLIESEVTIVSAQGGDIGTPANEDDTSVSVTVTPKAGSTLYQGTALTIQLTTPDTDIPLSTAIELDDMDGFDPA